MEELTKCGLPPLFSWVRARRTPTSRPILGFFYLDPTAGPSIKGSFVGDETDPVQIDRMLREPNATYRLPGFDYVVLEDGQAKKLGLPDFPAWYLKFFDDGTAALFTDRDKPARRSLAQGQYLEVTPSTRSIDVRVCGPDTGSSARQSLPVSSWQQLLRKATDAVGLRGQSQGDPMARHPLDSAAMTAIAARGRLIARLDRVTAGAADAVNALQPDASLLGYCIAYHSEDRWRVAFGRLSDTESVFLTAFEAVSVGRFGWPFDVLAFTPPREDHGWLRNAARAIATSLKQSVFSPDVDVYNCVVIPEDDKGISVYWYPGSKSQGVEVIGADLRVTIARDDTVTVEPYHKALIESQPGGTILAHTHLLVHDPVPLDVAYVLMRRPPQPMLVISENWTFFISRDGSIVPINLDDTVEIGDSLVAEIEKTFGDIES